MSLAFSTFPEDQGLQEQCKCYFIPRASDTPWVTAALKAEPLPLWRPHSSTNQGIISWIENFITSLTCSLQQGKASIHSVKVSAQTCKQENLFLALEQNQFPNPLQDTFHFIVTQFLLTFQSLGYFSDKSNIPWQYSLKFSLHFYPPIV